MYTGNFNFLHTCIRFTENVEVVLKVFWKQLEPLVQALEEVSGHHVLISDETIVESVAKAYSVYKKESW